MWMLLVKEDDKTHYVLITDFSKLMYSQTNGHRKLYYCDRCLQHFATTKILNEHIIDCSKIDAQKQYFQLKTINLLVLKNI